MLKRQLLRITALCLGLLMSSSLARAQDPPLATALAYLTQNVKAWGLKPIWLIWSCLDVGLSVNTKGRPWNRIQERPFVLRLFVRVFYRTNSTCLVSANVSPTARMK